MEQQQSHCRVHQGDMGEGLRKIDDQSPRLGVIFLRKEPPSP